jgi:CheY-like chemotaxis protein
MLYSQLMQQDSAMSQRGMDRLETIVQQSRRASELIQQILDFSRQSVLERQSLHLIPILKELAKLLVRTLPENIIIKLTFEHIPHLISADATRIQQMMMNLCLNARDAMPDGGELTINVESIQCEEDAPPPLPEMSPGAYLHIRVEDTGEGMSDEVLSHIWEPFYSTKDRGKGTGLGLAQVYGIVKQHQGFVDVVSEIGSGSSFHIYLPTVEIAPAPVSEKSKDKTPGGQGELILVVEDNAPTRNALEESLEVLGYEVVTAHNGQVALELMATLGEDIALVLSDVVMPTMGGREMLHRMREAGNQTKVIMLTGHLLDTPLEDLRAEGMFAWVMKPPTLAKLAQVIHEALHSEDDRL